MLRAFHLEDEGQQSSIGVCLIKLESRVDWTFEHSVTYTFALSKDRPRSSEKQETCEKHLLWASRCRHKNDGWIGRYIPITWYQMVMIGLAILLFTFPNVVDNIAKFLEDQTNRMLLPGRHTCASRCVNTKSHSAIFGPVWQQHDVLASLFTYLDLAPLTLPWPIKTCFVNPDRDRIQASHIIIQSHEPDISFCP